MRTLLLNSFLLLIVFTTNAQVKNQNIIKDTTDLNELIRPFIKDTSKIMTPKNVTRLLAKYQYQIGGSGIKDGRSSATAAVLDEKSLTINYSFHPINRMFFIQPRLAMTGTDNFVSILSKNKFSKIYSCGINFIEFRRAVINANEEDIKLVHNTLRFERAKFLTGLNERRTRYKELINKVIEILDPSKSKDSTAYKYFNSQYVDFNLDDSEAKSQLKKLKITKTGIDSLVVLGILNEDNIGAGKSQSLIDSLNCFLNSKNSINDNITGKYLSITDSIQINMNVVKKISWFTQGINYNNQNVPLLLNNSSASPTTFNNEYILFNTSYNYQRLGIKYNFILSPNFSYSNSRKFNDDEKKTVSFQSPVTLGTVSAQNIDSTISFFSSVSARLHTWNFELPFILYNTSNNFGIDIAVRGGGNNINDDNIGARLGLFIPVSKNDKGEAILIEPLVRFSKLFNSSTNKLFRDNFSVGINLSVSLPKNMN